MSRPHLISHHLCPYVQRAVIVLDEKRIAHDRTYIDLANKPDWFRLLSPLGRVPILEIGGTVLFESQVIAEYLDETTPGSLHPADALEKARHRAWIEFGSETLSAIAGFYGAADEPAFDAKRLALREKFQRIDKEVAGPFFAGDAFHMVDGVWGTIFRYFDVFDQIGDFDILTGLPAISGWRRSVAKRPSVINAPPEGYADRLHQFLRGRSSHLGRLAAGIADRTPAQENAASAR
ncbi:glutathione S-transferase family protein [Roseovarius sp. CAU 1744]|uniref:glutathione S-transferase family protein n=1 Tax=Roseovarius sp. CAU 1744 TaxID=3140368 RepID=UPI00325C2874